MQIEEESPKQYAVMKQVLGAGKRKGSRAGCLGETGVRTKGR